MLNIMSLPNIAAPGEALLEPSRTDTYGMYPYLEYPHRQSTISPIIPSDEDE
jgi:hypothetical protein